MTSWRVQRSNTKHYRHEIKRPRDAGSTDWPKSDGPRVEREIDFSEYTMQISGICRRPRSILPHQKVCLFRNCSILFAPRQRLQGQIS